ncbi:MAG: aspartate dehydrogenase [Pseudomonadota bacterium]
MELGIIGKGAIAGYVQRALKDRGYTISVALLRSGSSLGGAENDAPTTVYSADDLPAGIEHMIDCAGHQALRIHGPTILRRGIDLTTVSIGALADDTLFEDLTAAATAGNSKLHLTSGAVGGLDALNAASAGNLKAVTYIGRKPPNGWKGSPAETQLDLDSLSDPTTHFDGTARDAALQYPKNANVAAAVALAGVGFDATHVELIADPTIGENVHEVHAEGDFGRFSFQIAGNALPNNPRSSALAAMSVVSTVERAMLRVGF